MRVVLTAMALLGLVSVMSSAQAVKKQRVDFAMDDPGERAVSRVAIPKAWKERVFLELQHDSMSELSPYDHESLFASPAEIAGPFGGGPRLLVVWSGPTLPGTGATGNHSLWIFELRGTGPRLVLSTESFACDFSPRRGSRLPDVFTQTRGGGASYSSVTYRFDGRRYKANRCSVDEFVSDAKGMKSRVVACKFFD